MWKPPSQPRFSRARASAALLILASLGACAGLDQSQRAPAAPVTRSASAVPPSATQWGYAQAPAAQPAEPTYWGYAQAPAAQSSEPTLRGFAVVPAAQPTGPTIWGFATVPAERPAPAVQSSRESQVPVATQR